MNVNIFQASEYILLSCITVKLFPLRHFEGLIVRTGGDDQWYFLQPNYTIEVFPSSSRAVGPRAITEQGIDRYHCLINPSPHGTAQAGTDISL